MGSENATPAVQRREKPKYKPMNLFMINRFIRYIFHIKITFSLENYCAYCKPIAKVDTDLTEITTVLNFVAIYCLSPKTNITPFEVMRQCDIFH